MRAVLPGRPQAKLQALCTACWEGSRVVAYISGNALVILGGAHTLLQTIYHNEDEELQAIALDEDSGKFVVASQAQLYIYRPHGKEEGVLRWSLYGTVQLPPDPALDVTLSWGLSDELLVGRSQLTLYAITDTPTEIWSQQLPSPVKFAEFSYDAGLIASCGSYDRMLKIWRRLSAVADTNRFDFTYAHHPAAVTGMHWRRPFHREQAVPNILYTLCADNKLRIWAGFDRSALQTLQLWAEIDLLASIQPRTLDPCNVSNSRAAFIIDGRDFTLATEKAVQTGATSEKDQHALDRLIEIANRNPEVCIILDQKGHMSAWGIENIGSKTRTSSNIYNIAHIEGLNIPFMQHAPPMSDYAQFYGFCGDQSNGTITILGHFFDGRIEWLEGKVDHLFDPSPRAGRLHSKALWSGHSGPIKKIIRNVSGKAVVSRTDDNEVLVWKKRNSKDGTVLSRASSFAAEEHIHRFCFLGEGEFLINLHHHKIALWDTRSFRASKIASCEYSLSGKPLCIIIIPQSTVDKNIAHVATIGSDMKGIAWEVQISAARKRRDSKTTLQEPILKQFFTFDLGLKDDLSFVLPVDPAGSEDTISGFLDPFARDVVLAYTNSGILRTWTTRVDPTKTKVEWLLTSTVETGVENPTLASGSSIHKTALIDSSKTGLTIWDTRDTQLEHEQHFSEETIQDLDWTSTPDTQSILAVGFPHRVLLLSQLRYDYLSVKPAWTTIREIRVRDLSPHPIGDSCWLSDGNVVVGCGNQLYVYDKTIAVTDNLANDYRLTSPRSVSADMFDVVQRLNGPLPVFHPQFLAQCILAGKSDLVRRIILNLNKTLKFFVEGDEIDTFLDIPTGDFFIEQQAMNGSIRKEMNSSYADFSDDDEPGEVTEDVAASVTENLAKYALPHLSSREQIYLADIIECSATVSKLRRALDDNAARFLVFFRQHMLRRSHDPSEKVTISWREVVCAFHSESQDILLDQTSRQFNGKVLWEHARECGMFIWITDPAALKAQMEIIARNEYTKTDEKNPVDCSLYYLALKKKNVLQGLWRMAAWHQEQASTKRLLANNFQETRWKTAALKNAYALLGKHRYRNYSHLHLLNEPDSHIIIDYAAAFFLLAGNLRDAVNVCYNQLNDLQLGIAIARTYEGDNSPVFRELLEEKILPEAANEGNRWLASWAFWMLNRRDLAVRTLISPIHTLLETPESPGMHSKSYLGNDPALVILYKQLREKTVSTLKGASRVPRQAEWDFIIRNARLYDRMGCDILALDLVRNWEFLQQPPESKQQTLSVPFDPRQMLRRRASLVVDDLQSPKLPPPEMMKAGQKQVPTVFEEPDANSLLDSFGF
ncbi:MAG: regulator of (H+)-ATPase in vacuolar membrane [Cirrosporium novae-zelandiae]|nr:MAG: regulator of (H+)-ATPase in vacuolar membrane [Cirrosporium novae-zelandiae]